MIAHGVGDHNEWTLDCWLWCGTSHQGEGKDVKLVRGKQVRGNACAGYVTTQGMDSWLLALVWHIPSGRGKGCEAGEREAGEGQCLHMVCDNTRN